MEKSVGSIGVDLVWGARVPFCPPIFGQGCIQILAKYKQIHSQTIEPASRFVSWKTRDATKIPRPDYHLRNIFSNSVLFS